MTQVGPMRITDEDLVASAPAVRALLVARLEKMWAPVEAALEQSAAVGGAIPPDPRLLEIGLRIVRDEATLYRLAKPPQLADTGDADEIGPGVDRRAMIEATLVEREERLRGNG